MLCTVCSVCAVLLFPVSSLAEIKIIPAEADYIMGDGETPYFAEEMVLQKAKRLALEQAGTYVRSYTKVRNLDLTIDELETLAGGVLSVEILERRRTLEADGTRFSVKIRATIDTQNVDQLSGRIQKSDAVKQYAQLQDQYRRLTEEVELLKKQPVRAEHGFERQLILERIRSIESAFTAAQEQERSIFERLIAGDRLHERAELQLARQQEQKKKREKALDEFLKIIEEEGHVVHIGEPEIETDPDSPNIVQLNFPVSITPSGRVDLPLQRVREAYGNDLNYPAWRRIYATIQLLNFVLEGTTKDGKRIGCYATRYSIYKSPNSTEILAAEDGPHSIDAYLKIPRTSLKDLAGVRGFFSSEPYASCRE